MTERSGVRFKVNTKLLARKSPPPLPVPVCFHSFLRLDVFSGACTVWPVYRAESAEHLRILRQTSRFSADLLLSPCVPRAPVQTLRQSRLDSLPCVDLKHDVWTYLLRHRKSVVVPSRLRIS